MHSKRSKTITKAQARRFAIITREIGCVPCLIATQLYRQADANHILDGYRLGHDHVIPECPWHHRGICEEAQTEETMRGYLGPSRALHGKAFREAFGTDAELLEFTNGLVADFESKVIGGGKK